MNHPITRSCIRSSLEKQIVRRPKRLVRVRSLMCLLSIFGVLSLPTVTPAFYVGSRLEACFCSPPHPMPTRFYALAEWLGQCQIDTVVMESTGVYWVPLFECSKSAVLTSSLSIPMRCAKCPDARRMSRDETVPVRPSLRDEVDTHLPWVAYSISLFGQTLRDTGAAYI
jgi:hypothetical protein